MDRPTISVIVPVYNVAPYLTRCVDSLLEQNCPGMEIILVDDGSTDGSGALCDRMAGDNSNVRVIHQENAGPSAARNAGMAHAAGSYVTFADGDDTLEGGTLGKLWTLVQTDPVEVLRYGYLEVAVSGATRPWVPPYARGQYRGEALEPMVLDAVSYAHVLDYGVPRVLSACTALYRLDFLRRWGIVFLPEREILNEDYLFMVNVLCRAESVYVLPEPVYHYIARPGSLSRSPRPRMMERKRVLWNAYRALLPEGDREMEARLRNFYIDCVYDCFTDICNYGPRRGAIAQVRRLLTDDFLQQCLRENRDRIVGIRPRCICFLMAHRWAAAMWGLYRLMTVGKRGK